MKNNNKEIMERVYNLFNDLEKNAYVSDYGKWRIDPKDEHMDEFYALKSLLEKKEDKEEKNCC